MDAVRSDIRFTASHAEAQHRRAGHARTAARPVGDRQGLAADPRGVSPGDPRGGMPSGRMTLV
jgi:hypothetical protein